jgi:NADH-quinone oxidoreductase subunit C
MLLALLKTVLKKYLLNITFKQGYIYLTLKNSSYLLPVALLLKNSMFFNMDQLLDLWIVDLKDPAHRFQLNILLNSVFFNRRIIVRVIVKSNATVSSLSTVYPSSNWLERESFDMFGVVFEGHTDLRRILTDYGFEGYPLRKDFPLTGYLEVRFDDEINRIVFEPIELTQEYRNFVFVSPWERQ